MKLILERLKRIREYLSNRDGIGSHELEDLDALIEDIEQGMKDNNEQN